MLDQYAIVFNHLIPMYTISLVLALIASYVWLVWRANHNRGHVVDVLLGASLGGLLVGRLVHVVLNWAFFSENRMLIWQLQQEGGLNWHGVLLGALIAGVFVARWRSVPVRTVLEPAIIILPLLSLVGWYGCAAQGCAYGAEIERMSAYPDWLVWIAPDIYHLELPRFATQLIGMQVSSVLLVVSLVLYWRGWLKQSRFWLFVIAIAGLSFGTGFLRGDYALIWQNLRLHQWLDICVALVAIVMLGGGITLTAEDL